MAGDSDPRLSIVICTYNRPDLVAQVLGTLAEQDASRDAYEVLVVDNYSGESQELRAKSQEPRADRRGARGERQEATARSTASAVVAEFVGRIPGLRCVREAQVGLSHARNRGLREARGDYVGYVDDDCKLPPAWVSVALNVIDEARPVMFGGPARAFYMTPKPRWFRDDYGSAAFGDGAGTLPQSRSLSGMNMVIRKDALIAVGGFDPALGMTGMTMAYGEETALQGALRARFGSDAVYYDPDLYVFHLVRAEKMSVRWIVRRRFLGGLYGFRCGGEVPVPGPGGLRLWTKAARVAVGFALDVALGTVRRDRSRFPAIQNYIWEHASYRLERLGQIWGQMESRRPHQPPVR